MSPVRRTNAAGCSPSRRMKSASFFSARTSMPPNVSPAPRFEPAVSWLEPTAPPPSAGTSAPWVEPTVHFAGTSSSLLLVSSWMPLPASSSSLSPSSLSRSLAVSLSHCHSLSLSLNSRLASQYIVSHLSSARSSHGVSVLLSFTSVSTTICPSFPLPRPLLLLVSPLSPKRLA